MNDAEYSFLKKFFLENSALDLLAVHLSVRPLDLLF